MRSAARAAGLLLWALLGAAAAAGLALSGAYLALATERGRAWVAARALGLVSEAVAGRVELDRVLLTPGGALQLEGIRLYDPEGERVLAVESAEVAVDLSRLPARTVAARARLSGVALRLRPDPRGGTTLARALSPRSPPRPRPRLGPQVEFGWTVVVARLDLERVEVEVTRADGTPTHRVRGVAGAARGQWGPRGGRAELALRGSAELPVQGPVSAELAGSLRGDELAVPLLRAAAGDTRVELVAEGDLGARRGRLAVLSLGVEGADLERLVAGAPRLADARGTLYFESDGRVATAALEVRPAAGGGGSARAAAAARLAGARTLGLDVSARELDPRRLVPLAPEGSLTFSARGRLRGLGGEAPEGSLELALGASRLRSGEVGPGEIRATARRDAVEVASLDLRLPGGSVRGAGTWRRRGPLGGRVAVDVSDLGALLGSLAGLAGEAAPRASGAARIEAEVAGSGEAPELRVEVASRELAVAGVSAAGLSLRATAAGAPGAPALRLEATAARLRSGEVAARDVGLRGSLEERRAELRVDAVVPAVGPDPFALEAAGAFDPGRRSLEIAAASLSWPGSRFALAAPARLDLDGPRVDRLELRSGAEALWAEGGRRGEELELRLGADGLDLARLPRALLPFPLGGRLTASAEVGGRAASPEVAARARWERGSAGRVDAIEARAELGYHGPTSRISGSLSARRDGTGEVEAEADLPLGARPDPASPLRASASARGLVVEEILRLSGSDAPLAGVAAASLAISGAAGRPALRAEADLREARWADLGPLEARLRVDDPEGKARFAAEVDDASGRALDVEGSLPLDVAALLRDPPAAWARLGAAPLEARASAPGLDLARYAGRAGIPRDLSGRLTAGIRVSGSARSPRGEAELAVAGGGWAGAEGVDLELRVRATERSTEAEARASLAGAPALRGKATVAAPVEAALDRARLLAAPLSVEAVLGEVDLARAGRRFPGRGTLGATLAATGTLGRPRGTLRLRGARLEVRATPLGDLRAEASLGPERLRAEADFDPAGGGRVAARLEVDLPASFREGWPWDAPARARVEAAAADLGFLPAALPGLVRSARGRLDGRVTAEGTLRALEPTGTVRVAGGSLAVSEYGEWTEIELEGEVGDQGLRIPRLEARRAKGTLSARLEVRGRPGREAPVGFEGEIHMKDLAIPRGGLDLVTLGFDARLSGTGGADELRVDATVERGEARLPRSQPQVQSLAPREDVVVLGRQPRRPGAGAGAEPYRLVLHVVVPGHFTVKSETPKTDLQLKADATLDAADRLLASGRVEVLRGRVEPLPGREFEVRRAVVRFTGGELESAQVDAVLYWENPTAKVTVTISGSVRSPQIKMTSEPPLDEGQIALLVATGRTDLRAGSGGAEISSAEQAGAAAAGMFLTRTVRDIVSEQLPVNAVISSSQVRAGTYVSDRIYVGYTRRFNARIEAGENANEVHLEYRISPRWNFDLSWGDANTGAASLLWTRDY